ncbi:P-loop containing nucleoside triphosphate hydrolase protein [Mycena pura]|uniref:P-loop containing nucleoside triphosphate hydrolase protein n=1 Tax=Mycena pura TaxID=153505 RepID=A0AAD6VEX1_9AGAR|nr:P-loop containing nucleoside triphosphate hydrolase protein [Mycena pura]
MSTNITPDNKANWLGRALLTVRVATASAEVMPFPYVKGVFATITTVLEAVEKVRKSRDILKELCEDIAEITSIVRDKLSQDPDKVAGELEDRCKELNRILQDVLITIQKMQKTRYFLKEMFKATEIADEIAGYQAKIKKLVSNFMLVTAIQTHDIVAKTGHEVHEIHEAVRAGMISNVEPIVKVAQSINNCPAPSRIFHGRQTTLDQMSDYFKQDNGNQHVYLLHGLGGSGKTQLALKFISQSASQFSDIFIVDTSTTETIDSSLKSIAIMKSAGMTAEGALLWLTSKHEKWLLLFDNADDPSINLNTWLPHCNHGNIIITSRNPELHIYAGILYHFVQFGIFECAKQVAKSARICPKNPNFYLRGASREQCRGVHTNCYFVT